MLYLIFSLLYISSFLILSLLVTPSILCRHVISNTLKSLFLLLLQCPCLRVVPVSRTCVSLWSCSCLLSSICHVLLARPILLSTSLSDPFCVLMFPRRCTKFSVCSRFSPSTSR